MSERDLATAREAIARRDFAGARRGDRGSCLSMHASAMAARRRWSTSSARPSRAIARSGAAPRRRAGLVHLRRGPARQGAHRRGQRARGRSGAGAARQDLDLQAGTARGGASSDRSRARARKGDPRRRVRRAPRARRRSRSPSTAQVVARQGVPEPGVESPFVRAAKSWAEKSGGAALGDVIVDSSALYEGGDKLGLGSSAAVTAAVVGLAMAKAERTLEPHVLFAIADAAHAEAQGTRGSGVDVACSVYGGAIRFVRKNGDVDVRVVDLPDGVRLTFIWAGQPALDGGADRPASRPWPRARRRATKRPSAAWSRTRTPSPAAVNANDADGLRARRRCLRPGDGRARRRRRLRHRHRPHTAAGGAGTPSRRRGQTFGRRRRRPGRRLHHRQRRHPAAARRCARRRPHAASRSALRRRACDWRIA